MGGVDVRRDEEGWGGSGGWGLDNLWLLCFMRLMVCFLIPGVVVRVVASGDGCLP